MHKLAALWSERLVVRQETEQIVYCLISRCGQEGVEIDKGPIRGRQAGSVRASPGAVMSCLTPSQSHTAAHPSEFVELIPCSSEDRQI